MKSHLQKLTEESRAAIVATLVQSECEKSALSGKSSTYIKYTSFNGLDHGSISQLIRTLYADLTVDDVSLCRCSALDDCKCGNNAVEISWK